MQSYTTRRVAPIAAILVVLALAAAGCGSSSSSSTTASATTKSIGLAKTKFVLHSGLAFGAFHHWIYGPIKAGDLKNPLSHKVTLFKAALAAGFVYHEVKLALADAQANPTLSKLVAPLTALEAKLKGVPSGLKSGSLNGSDLDSTNASIDSIKQQAASAGQPITEQVPASP